MLARLGRDLPQWLRQPITLAQARARVRHGLATRESRFLRLMDRTVYSHPQSPYRALLRHIGCEPGDLRELVRRQGLEPALRSLTERGVYVTYDELKGRQPIVRGSLTVKPSAAHFDNPLLHPHIPMQTGGSGGRPVAVHQTLALNTELAEMDALTWDAHGVFEHTKACWTDNPITRLLIPAKLGRPLSYWFYRHQPLARPARAGTAYLRALYRLGGTPFPVVRHVDLDEVDRLAWWLERESRERGPICIAMTPSAAVRVARAACDAGRSLDRVTFAPRSEAVTEARHRNIAASGAGLIVDYGSLEVMSVAASCPHGTVADDLHLYTHRHAVIQRRREAMAGGPLVDALLFTSLSAQASKICFNAELGDYADLEERRGECCALGGLGLTTHLSRIRSFEKLTGEGVTVAASDVLRVIEEVLPARFGGASIDYQLVEQDDARSLPRLVLRAHPRVGPIDEVAIRRTLLEEFARGNLVDRNVASTWERARTIEIRREPPLASRAGKILPFHRDPQPR